MPPDRPANLRAALATSARLATDVDAVLGRYEAGLARVLKDVRPTVDKTQVRWREMDGEAAGARAPRPPLLCPLLITSLSVLSQALRAARAEVRAALADAELTLHHLDTPRRVEAAVLAGPEADLPGFLCALADLGAATAFLDPRKGDLPAAEAAVESADTLRRDGLALALRNFVTLLQLHRGGAGEGEGEGEGVEDGGGRWRPSEEGGGAFAPGDEEANATTAALDYDSEEGSDVEDGTGPPGTTDPSPFLSRAPDFEPAPPPGPPSGPPPGHLAVSIMPPPVTARLRALADAMVAAGNVACVKVRRFFAGPVLPSHDALSVSLSRLLSRLRPTATCGGATWTPSCKSCRRRCRWAPGRARASCWVWVSAAGRPMQPTGSKGKRRELRELFGARTASPSASPPRQGPTLLLRTSAARRAEQGALSNSIYLASIKNSWCLAVRRLVRIATSERDLAAAVFNDPHAGEAAMSVLGRAVDLVVAGGQGLIAMRRSAPKARGGVGGLRVALVVRTATLRLVFRAIFSAGCA